MARIFAMLAAASIAAVSPVLATTGDPVRPAPAYRESAAVEGKLQPRRNKARRHAAAIPGEAAIDGRGEAIGKDEAAAIECKLCHEARDEVRERSPIEVSIESGISFSRMALLSRGDGEAEIDPVTGQKRTTNNLVDLGGTPFSGRARVTGEPMQPVRVDLPGRVTLHSPSGATAELTDFVTDLPDMPVLDANGSLEFSFGGRLRTQGGDVGNFRGRIPIRVDYN